MVAICYFGDLNMAALVSRWKLRNSTNIDTQVMKDDEVARDMASPNWLMRPPFVCFRVESVFKNKPICDYSG